MIRVLILYYGAESLWDSLRVDSLVVVVAGIIFVGILHYGAESLWDSPRYS